MFSIFIKWTKDFDKVSGEGLWKILATYSCPQKCITIVQQLYDEMQAGFYDKYELWEPFPVLDTLTLLLESFFVICLYY